MYFTLYYVGSKEINDTMKFIEDLLEDWSSVGAGRVDGTPATGDAHLDTVVLLFYLIIHVHVPVRAHCQ